MVLFAGSCIGLLIFLWTSFGGSIPFAPEGYRFTVEFDQAVQLADQSDVRISGVSVGKVISVGLDHHTGKTRAVIQIDRQFAPRPADTRAILRAKSLLGETFVELTPGSQNGPKLPDGGQLPTGHVAPTVQLDQILSTFDPQTRRAFQTWMQQGRIALTNRGQDFNAAFAELYPFATNVNSVLTVLNRQTAATRALLREGGLVFGAIGRSPTQLQGFVRNSNAVFSTTASRNAALAGAVRAFPAFTAATRLTIARLDRFAQFTKPLIDELIPAAVKLNPVLQRLPVLAPELLRLVTKVAPLTSASKQGFPALGKFLNESVPLLTRLRPYLGGVVPVINYINTYRREIAAFFANSSATTEGRQPAAQGGVQHYVRISNPINPEVVAAYPRRLSTNRGNPYLAPGAYAQLLKGLPVFGSYLCTSTPLPTFGPSLSTTTTTLENQVLTLAQLLQTYYYTADPGGPPCRAQPPLGRLTVGQLQAFPHLNPLP